MKQFLESSETELNKKSMLEIWDSFQSTELHGSHSKSGTSPGKENNTSNAST
jgi:hypothetical protein